MTGLSGQRLEARVPVPDTRRLIILLTLLALGALTACGPTGRGETGGVSPSATCGSPSVHSSSSTPTSPRTVASCGWTHADEHGLVRDPNFATDADILAAYALLGPGDRPGELSGC